ncbi:hypothetical protein V6N13_027834 [Hibiscus sabdariffa]|uniref:SKP1-like protein n=2 Tax=Hibiscus sabdariffa TaxID=183260 RepID=A0ABR1ZB64_9ROSI
MASTSKKMITLKSSDGEIFEIDEAVALQSYTIKNMIKDDCVDGEIPIPGVNGKTLSKVLEYCKRLADVAANTENSSDELQVWEAEFANVDMDAILDFMTAANCLVIVELLDLTCKTMADRMWGKTLEQFRETFNIKNDYTPEEEEALIKENYRALND